MGFLGFAVQSCGAAGLRVSPPLLTPPSQPTSSLLLSLGKRKKTLCLIRRPDPAVLPLVFSSSEDFISLFPFPPPPAFFSVTDDQE